MRLLQLALLLLASIYSKTAISCSCMVTPIAQKIESSTTIIEGVVIKGELVSSGDFQRSKKYTFKVEKTYKGKTAEEYSVFTAYDSGGCGVDFTIGAKYVVLVYENDQVGSCGAQEEWYDEKWESRADLNQVGLLKELRKTHNKN